MGQEPSYLRAGALCPTEEPPILAEDEFG
jgi:hypothetical protein